MGKISNKDVNALPTGLIESWDNFKGRNNKMTYTKKLISGQVQTLSSACQEVTIYYKNMIVEAFIQRIHTFLIHSVRNILENIIQYLFKRPS